MTDTQHGATTAEPEASPYLPPAKPVAPLAEPAPFAPTAPIAPVGSRPLGLAPTPHLPGAPTLPAPGGRAVPEVVEPLRLPGGSVASGLDAGVAGSLVVAGAPGPSVPSVPVPGAAVALTVPVLPGSADMATSTPVLPAPGVPPASVAPSVPGAGMPVVTGVAEQPRLAPAGPAAEGLPVLPVLPAPAPAAAAVSPVPPSYTTAPNLTDESRSAAERLREEARRKRRRNRRLGRAVAAGVVAGLAGAGVLAYLAFQSDQDHEREPATAPAGAPATADRDEASGPIAAPIGGMIAAVGDAQSVAGEINGDAPLAALGIDAVRPGPLVAHATRLDDVGGFERYVVDVAGWSGADPAGYAAWLARLGAQPQLDPALEAFHVVPADLAPGQLGVAVQPGGEGWTRLIVAGADPALHVDVAAATP